MLATVGSLKGYTLNRRDGEIGRVSWSEAKVVVNLSRESITGAPAYSEGMLLNRD